MKSIKAKNFFVLVLLAILALVIGCGEETNYSITSSKQELSLNISDEVKLPIEYTEGANIIVSVDEVYLSYSNGTIKALKSGSTKVVVSLKEDETKKVEINVIIKENHSHEYNKEVVDAKYLAEEATCTSKAKYYYSCECGEKGTETFESGEVLAHTFDQKVVDDKYLASTATKDSPAKYYYSCKCGEKGTETFTHGEALKPIFVEEIKVVLNKEMNISDSQEFTVEVLPNDAENKEYEVILENDNLKLENNKLSALKDGTCKVTFKTKEGSNVSFEIEITILDNRKEKAEELLNNFMLALPKETMVDLPLGTEDFSISYKMDKCFSNDGKITREEYDYTSNGQVVINYQGYELAKDYSVIVYGTFTDSIVEAFLSALPSEVSESVKFLRSTEDYGGTRIIINECDKPEVLSKTGVYTIPFHDEIVTFSINVRTTTPKASRFYEVPVKVAGRDIKYKTNEVMNWLFTEYKENMVLYYDSPMLPKNCDDYDATIEWLDSKGNTLDFNSIAQDPVLGESQVLSAKITIRGETYTQTADYFVWNKHYQSDEEKIDDFVKAINWQDIRSYKYKSGAYYENNYGYLPFFTPGDAVRIQDYMCEYTYGHCRTGILKTSTEYIVIHDTAGGSPTHTAQSFAQDLFNQNNRENNDYISWHFSVGEDGIYQSLPLDEVAYHAGDGSHVYGDTWYSSTYNKYDCIGGGNRNGIGIESCINLGADYNVTLRKLAKLVAELLLENNLSLDRIKQHWNFSGKDCPGVIRHTGRWQEFRNLVKLEYFAKTQLQGATFEWKSLTPDVMDDTGKIIVTTGVALNVKYSVKVSFNNVNKDYEYTSNILEHTDLSDANLSGNREY